MLVQRGEHEAIFLQRNADNPPWLIYRLQEDGDLIAYFQREDERVAAADKFVYKRVE